MATVTLSRKALKAGQANTVRANDWDNLITVLNALVTAVTELKTDLSEHVHGGVTAGGANTSAGPTIAAATPDTVALDK
jgi:hypothetical protein